jgi:hypothetical protein
MEESKTCHATTRTLIALPLIAFFVDSKSEKIMHIPTLRWNPYGVGRTIMRGIKASVGAIVTKTNQRFA